MRRIVARTRNIVALTDGACGAKLARISYAQPGFGWKTLKLNRRNQTANRSLASWLQHPSLLWSSWS